MTRRNTARSISRRSFLLGGAAALATAALPWRLEEVMAQSRAAQSRNLLLVFVGGGWDVTGALDPKPGLAGIDAPPGEVQTFAGLPILTGADRPAVARFFQTWGSRCAVVNGVEVRSIAHEECTKRILTGTNSDASPDMGAIAGVSLGADLAVPYMILGNTAFAGPFGGSTGRAGLAGQFITLLHPEAAYSRAINRSDQRFVPDAGEASLIKDFVRRRAEADREARGTTALSRQRLDDLARAVDRRDRLKPLITSFRDFSAQLEFQPQVELAVRLFKDGLARAAMIEHGGEWDTHDANHARQLTLYEDLFAGLDDLMERLEAASLLDDTVVVVLSEMSRTPRLNEAQGKDHWPVTSALVLGAGVRGGAVIGGTDDRLLSRPTHLDTGLPDPGGAPLSAAHLASGVLHLLGVDPSPWYPGLTPLRALAAT